jgi:phospholipid/cholesterol/gamma-HCH transport system substrate-binding protein
MPRTRSLAWSELKVGLLAVFALVMTAVLIFAVGGSGGFFWQRYPLKTEFPNVAGIKSGSPVRVAGVEVGAVTDVEFSGAGVVVEFEVAKERRPLITTASRATIGSVSLLGEGAIDITAAPGATPIPDWGYVQSEPAKGSLTEVASEATDSLVEARKLIQDIRSGRGTIGQLFTDEAVYRDLDRFVNSAERVANQISSGRGTLGRLTNDPAVYKELEAAVRNLNEVTSRIRNGEGSLGQLLHDPALAESMTKTTQNLEGITGRLSKGEGTAGKLMNDDALYNRLNSMADRLDTLTARLIQGEGTAGQLLHDKQLYENMNHAVGELRGLIAEIRKDPKKYLNVKVSIF